MERKIYLKPAMKMLETERIMFEPGGGLSEATPVTPGVGAKESMEEVFEGYSSYSVWSDDEYNLQ